MFRGIRLPNTKEYTGRHLESRLHQERAQCKGSSGGTEASFAEIGNASSQRRSRLQKKKKNSTTEKKQQQQQQQYLEVELDGAAHVSQLLEGVPEVGIRLGKVGVDPDALLDTSNTCE